MAHMGQDKKVIDGQLRFILARGIGEAFVASDVPRDAVRAVLTAALAAHEMGHFLGLFNTSEPTQGLFDPLVDTPRCTDTFPEFTRAICPDGDNLMFPLLTSQLQVEITPNQSSVIRANPLTREL